MDMTHSDGMALLKTIGCATSGASLGAFCSRQFIDGVLQQLSAVLDMYNDRMEAAVASLMLHHPGVGAGGFDRAVFSFGR